MATFEDVASRRVQRIAHHLTPAQNTSCPSNLSTLVCSNRASSSRKDARVMYGRQIHHFSLHSGASTEPQMVSKACVSSSGIQPGVRKDNRLLYARQSSHIMQSDAMKNMISQEIMNDESSVSKPTHYKIESSHHEENPLFSRPTNQKEGKELSSDEPLFARNSQQMRGFINKNKISKWVPRMDVTESRLAYNVVVELPGVNADELRVEINNDRLLVSGVRGNIEFWENHTIREQGEVYHQKELSRGPYNVSWAIPKDSETHLISAELIDGFLRILVPKAMV